MAPRLLKGFSHETILGMLIDTIRDVSDPDPIRCVASKEELIDHAAVLIAEIYKRLAEADKQKLLATLRKG